MAELTKEDTSKLWDDMQVYWDIKKGKKDGDVKKSEKGINRIQGLLGLEVIDFGKETPTKEMGEYTLAQAEEFLGEDNLIVIEKGLDFAIAYREVIADMTPKKYPKLKNNPAGIGQMVNISYDKIKYKLK